MDIYLENLILYEHFDLLSSLKTLLIELLNQMSMQIAIDLILFLKFNKYFLIFIDPMYKKK